MAQRILFFILLLPALLFGADSGISDNQLVLRKSDSPLIAFRIQFLTGSARDPKGKEGLASLTSSMLEEGSTQKNDYPKILQLLFPMAASYTAQTDKEMTTIVGVVHQDNLMPYYQLLRDAVLSPAFKQEEFDRFKTDQGNYVAKTLRFNDDEELGKEALNWRLFPLHPYGHPNEGTVTGNQSIALQDVKDFYQGEYTRKHLVIGVSGNYPESLIQEIKKDFSALPEGTDRQKIPAPETAEDWKVLLIEKNAPATAFSMGFPLAFTRSDTDFYPMMVLNAWFGQHRTQFGHLYSVMREARGLNYGDYSYIEHFALGGRTFQPRPNYARSRQIFQIWIRPVPNAARHFALRQAVRELQKVIDNGMAQKDFDATKTFLLNYIVSLAQSNSEQLGYAIDDHFYGLSKPYLQMFRSKMESMTLQDVNQAIKRNLSMKSMTLAIVTSDAESFKKALVENTPSPMHYESPKPDAIVEEDKQIMNYSLPIKAENVTIIPAEKIFE